MISAIPVYKVNKAYLDISASVRFIHTYIRTYFICSKCDSFESQANLSTLGTQKT